MNHFYSIRTHCIWGDSASRLRGRGYWAKGGVKKKDSGGRESGGADSEKKVMATLIWTTFLPSAQFPLFKWQRPSRKVTKNQRRKGKEDGGGRRGRGTAKRWQDTREDENQRDITGAVHCST